MTTEEIMQELGIKETKELAVAMIAAGFFAFERLSDGVDLEDLKAAWEKFKDEKFRDKIKEGAEGITLVAAEVKDADAGELVELAKTVIEEIMYQVKNKK